MSSPAPATAALAALTTNELRLAARRGEGLLVTMAVPPAVLLFFAASGMVPGPGEPVDFLLPGAMALAIIATAFVALAISTGYDRAYGVLKRLGGAPVAPGLVIAAKGLAALAIVVAQLATLVVIAAVVLGWLPGQGWSPIVALFGVVLGTAAFASLGLLLAGSLRAEATLALANGLFLAFLMLGGIVLPVDHLPDGLQPLAAVLPATALADILRVGLGGGGEAGPPAALLGAWTVAFAALAARRFRWE